MSTFKTYCFWGSLHDEKNTVNNLALTGNIDARDFTCMRDQLIKLNDISAASIVAYNGTGGIFEQRSDYAANEIPEYAFSYDQSTTPVAPITRILLPTGLTSLDNYAFQGCKLVEVIIPNTVETIGEGAFKFCNDITSLTLSNVLKKIENTVFYRCYGLTSVVIPNSVTEIGSSAFYQCTNLASINIPNSVKSIGDHAFEACG